ncbi:TIGR02587 family membrane protein [Pontibacter sp. E15-1]|uniref:TIGR02587 family membrane protein n=1 Tax=Pontibacter sp. E15-1 TaxID=2919918 RepID=UPI001F4FB19C|nr:TIGR02587 family membrane protein [Pontibacter sp. E15-1]MCJ8163447.1 TIGR02587 family membrane protein [Pontibacter sp. E15-1]
MKTNSLSRPVSQSLKEYARGVAGGLLFSFPMLYTMEVWWAGFIATPFQLMVLIVVTYLLLLGYNRYAGMRPDASWRSVFVDSVEEMGLGVILSFGILLMLNRISLHGMSVEELMSKVIIEAMAISIGVSVGTAQLGVEPDDAEEENGEEQDRIRQEQKRGSGKMATAVIALCGAILVGGNVAPTEEILMIAVEAEPVHILSMALVSLVLSTVVVSFSDFRNTSAVLNGNVVFNILYDTCISYLIALAASAFSLWFFGRFDGVSFWIVTAQCITLGVIATLGASAGRLLIK